MAKLKARPFLAEGTLIEPPKVISEDRTSLERRQQQQQQQQQRRTPTFEHHQQQRQSPNKLNHIEAHNVLQSRTRTVGSSQSYEHDHGTDGNYFYKPASSPANSLDQYSPTSLLQTFQSSRQSSPGGHSSGSSSRYSEAAMSNKSLSPKSIKSDRSSKQGTTATAHLYNLEDLPRSPRYYTQQPPTEVTFNSMGNKEKYSSKDYCSNQNYLQEHGYVAITPTREPPNSINPNLSRPMSTSASSSPSLRTTPTLNIHRHTQGRKYNSYDRLAVENNSDSRDKQQQLKSAPYYQKEGQFEFPDGCVQSSTSQGKQSEYTKVSSRPYSNPELDAELITNSYNLRNDQSGQSLGENMSPPPRQMRPNQKQSNYSSPNIYSDSQRQMSNEQKELTLTPSTLSSHSLSKLSSNSNSRSKDYSDPIHSPLHITLNNSSMASSSTVSPMSFLAESEISSSVSSQNKEEVAPADIASRLFTLNGYKASDVAPLLGKK